MVYCAFPVMLAYIAVAVALSSLLYLMLTRCLGNYSSAAFIKSLTARQRRLMKRGAAQRGMIFWGGFFVFILGLLLWRPFSDCH